VGKSVLNRGQALERQVSLRSERASVSTSKNVSDLNRLGRKSEEDRAAGSSGAIDGRIMYIGGGLGLLVIIIILILIFR